jgi:hypothetical protein
LHCIGGHGIPIVTTWKFSKWKIMWKMHEDTMHATPRQYHSRHMGMLLEWHAQNIHSCITFMCGVRGLGNFVWEVRDMRSFLHVHVMCEVY